MNIFENKKLLIAYCVVVCCFLLGYFFHGKNRYNEGYAAGWTAAVEASCQLPEQPAAKADTVTAAATTTVTATTTVQPRQTASDPVVAVKTETPKTTVTVNDKQYTFDAKTEVLQTGIKTQTDIKVKIPERRWVFGVGTDGKRPMYMLKAPISGAVGAWVAGGSHKFMGGVSISF